MGPTERFAAAVRPASGLLRLDEMAFSIAAHAHPGLDVNAQLKRLDDLADAVGEPTLDGIRRHLFRDLGFAGNLDDYYDPENSFLNSVLDRRLGIPISLAVVTLEVARRLSVPLVGIAMPGHFLVGDRVDPDLYVDVFAAGRLLSTEDCEQRLRERFGPGTPLDRETMLPEADAADIANRMLLNLRAIYMHAQNIADLRWVVRLLAELSPEDPARWNALGEVEERIGSFADAARHFDRAADVLSEVGDPDDEESARMRALSARARLN